MARERNVGDDVEYLIAQIEKEMAIKKKFVEGLRETIKAGCTGGEIVANISGYLGEHSCEIKLESKKTVRLLKKASRSAFRPLG